MRIIVEIKNIIASVMKLKNENININVINSTINSIINSIIFLLINKSAKKSQIEQSMLKKNKIE